MLRLHRISIALLTAASGLAATGRSDTVAAQDAAATAQAALSACTAADGAAAERKRAADEEERRYRTLLRQQPQNPELRVGLAQILIRCQLPHASVTGVMSLVGEAESELKAVLNEHPEHWNAAFTLAMLLRNMPPMLGRAGDAVREFERLIALQGDRADRPNHALPFVQLGDLHEYAGRPGLRYSEARVRALDAFERAFLTASLERHGGNISATARDLGIRRQSLQKMLRRLNLPAG